MLRGTFNALHVSNEEAKSSSPMERLMMLCPFSLAEVKWAWISRIMVGVIIEG
jgi:hypothetical protein